MRTRPFLSKLAPLALACCSLVTWAHAGEAGLVDDAVLRVLAALAPTAERAPGARPIDDGLLARAPGLHARVLAESGKADEACAVLARASTTPGIVGAEAARAALLCVDDAARARLLVSRALDDARLATDPLVLEEIQARAAKLGLVEDGALAARALALDPPVDTVRREALARVWAAIGGADEARATARLVVEAADTLPAIARFATRPVGAWQTALGDEKLLARARVLEQRHANDALLATLAPLVKSAKDTSEAACEARFLVGKTERKRRRYQAARAALDVVSKDCGEPWKKKALYTNARVAAFALTKDAGSVVDAFLAAYPNDSLTDDVMVWKAELAVAKGDARAAEQVYADLVARFPDGDMAIGARFSRAFLVAERGDVARALVLLDEMSRAVVDGSPLDRDQSAYWRARLEAFPALSTWEPNKDEGARARGLASLAALAASRPTSTYGYLARLVVEKYAPSALPARPAPIARPDMRALLALVSSTEGASSDALALASAGFVDGAARLVDAGLAWGGRRALETVTSDAAIFALLGRDDRAHQVMRGGGHALLAGAPSPVSARYWALAYPRAHDEAIRAAAKGEGIPPELLMGLAREESAFDAAVTSWAGALGLCQLMPGTAREEAARTKRPAPTVESLRAPELNAALGAAHLARRVDELGHPFFGIAAYNAGPGNVAKWHGYLPIDAWMESIPVEQTRGYVKKVTGSWVTYALLDGGEAPALALELPRAQGKKKR